MSSGCLTIPWRSTRGEVLRRREEDGRAGRAVGGAGDHPAVELVDPDDARVLEAPLLARRSRPVRAAARDRSTSRRRRRASGRRRGARSLVRSSTRASRTVSPSTIAAAGLKTALTGYGQSSAVRIGLAGCRAKSSAALTPLPVRAPARQRRPECRPRRAGARRDGARASTRRLRSRSAPRCRARRCSRRWRSRRAVSAGCCVRGTTRRRGSPGAVLGIARDGVRGQLGLDEGGGVERLLVTARPARARPAAGLDARRGGGSAPSSPDSSPSQRSDSRPRSTRSSRPSASPPLISACESRALS